MHKKYLPLFDVCCCKKLLLLIYLVLEFMWIEDLHKIQNLVLNLNLYMNVYNQWQHKIFWEILIIRLEINLYNIVIVNLYKYAF